jgi:hypothetical protein
MRRATAGRLGRTALALGLSALSVVAACGRAPQAAQPTLQEAITASPVTAKPVQPVPTVGALFLGSPSLHTCSGAVLHSDAGNLILTAAHCIGGGADIMFVPGFSGDSSPANTWKVEAVYLDPRWVANQNPLADYAIARVGRDGGGQIESPTGSGLSLGQSPRVGTVVKVTGYGLGAGGTPIGCEVPTTMGPGGFPSLACTGLVDGTSGAPWVAGSTITGLIGGLHGGGCEQQTLSYSPPFDDQTARLLARAEAGGPGDTAPVAFADDCAQTG